MTSMLTNGFKIIPLNVSGNSTFGSPQIQSVRNTKDCATMVVPIPNENSDKTLSYDLLGVKREITVSGIVAGTTAQIEAFINGIEELVNGDQYNSLPYNIGGTSYTEGLVLSIDYHTQKNYLCIVKSFSHIYNKGSPGKLDYTLNVVEKENIA